MTHHPDLTLARTYAVTFPVGVRHLQLVAIDGDTALLIDGFSDEPITVPVSDLRPVV